MEKLDEEQHLRIRIYFSSKVNANDNNRILEASNYKLFCYSWQRGYFNHLREIKIETFWFYLLPHYAKKFVLLSKNSSLCAVGMKNIWPSTFTLELCLGYFVLFCFFVLFFLNRNYLDLRNYFRPLVTIFFIQTNNPITLPQFPLLL